MIKVRYHRPGKETREWEQKCLKDEKDIIVSSFIFCLSEPFIVNGLPVIYDGYRGILFDFFDRWYNVVKIYDEKRGFVGYYSDIRTPPERIPEGYEAVDLVLDLWVEPDGNYTILDEDEFEEAEMDDHLRKKAEETLSRLIKMIEKGRYPPVCVSDTQN